MTSPPGGRGGAKLRAPQTRAVHSVGDQGHRNPSTYVGGYEAGGGRPAAQACRAPVGAPLLGAGGAAGAVFCFGAAGVVHCLLICALLLRVASRLRGSRRPASCTKHLNVYLCASQCMSMTSDTACSVLCYANSHLRVDQMPRAVPSVSLLVCYQACRRPLLGQTHLPWGGARQTTLQSLT